MTSVALRDTIAKKKVKNEKITIFSDLKILQIAFQSR